MRLLSQATVLAGVTAGMLAMPLSPAQAQADFYKGKTISIVIGAKTGSLAVAAQIVGRHLGKHIPGNPTVINRQMPGGAHLNATNNIFNVADADGLTILAANPNVAMGQLAKLPNVRFDVNKFIWLGSSGPDGSMFSIRADAAVTRRSRRCATPARNSSPERPARARTPMTCRSCSRNSPA